MIRELSAALRPALMLTLLLFALTGLAYPLALTGIGAALMPDAAAGSLVKAKGRVVGSALIGQNFVGDGWFHPRPSAAGAGYDPLQSGGTNLAPTSRALIDRVAAAHRAAPGAPIDLLTTSASGLDPDISPEAAEWQVPRVAAARHMAQGPVLALVEAHVERPLFGLIGQPRVNVLALNLALDKLAGDRAHSP